MTKKIIILVITILFGVLCPYYKLSAQNLPIEKWISALSDSSSNATDRYNQVRSEFSKMDSLQWRKNIGLLGKKIKENSPPRLLLRYTRLRADVTITGFHSNYQFEKLITDADKSFNYALQAHDSDLLFEAYNNLAGILIGSGHEKPAMTYLVREEKLFGKRGFNYYDYPINSVTMRLSGLSYHTGNFKESIHYSKKALQYPNPPYEIIVGCHNTIGVCYRELEKFDSAQYYLNLALNDAIKHKDSIYYNIVRGNMAFNYYYHKDYDSCNAILKKYLRFCYEEHWNYEAAKVLYTSGNILMKKNDLAGAEKQFLEAEKEFLKETDKTMINLSTLAGIYCGLTRVAHLKNDCQAELKYTSLMYSSTASFNKFTYENDIKSVKIAEELEDKEERIQSLEKARFYQRIRAGGFLIIFMLILIGGLMILGNRRKEFRLRENMLKEGKKLAEQRLLNAQLQLGNFTNSFIQQNKAIDELTSSLNQANNDRKMEDALVEIDRLQKIRILTDDDWQEFKTLYNKAYPGFFQRLADRYPYLTPAESRYAALIKLGLDNKQMAHILAISTDSMRKLKFRFREKTNIEATHDEDIRRILNEI